VLVAGRGWSVVPTIDPITGQIAIALSSTTPIGTDVGGSLVTIDFHQTTARAGPAAIELVASVNPNGQVVTTELEDAQGTFTLTPAPSNGFGPRLDGVVFLTSPLSVFTEAEAASIGTPTPLETPSADSRSPDAYRFEVANPNPAALATESDAQDQDVGPRVRTEVAPVLPSVVSVQSAILLAVPGPLALPMVAPPPTVSIPSLGFQFGGTPSAGLGAAQLIVDQQSRARGTAFASDPVLVLGTVKEAWAQTLARLLLQPPLALDSLEGLQWEASGSKLDWQGAGEWFAPGGSRSWGDGPSRVAGSATLAPTASDCAAVDRIFAPAEEPSNQEPEDDLSLA
jgi:hypothetical protein